MSDNGATAFPTQLAVTCGFCGDTNDVTWFCKWCAGSLCSTCKTSHQTIPMFKSHTVVPRTNDVMRLHGPSKIAEQCQIHLEKEISTYCNDCQVPCCAKCLVKNHQRHKISTIEHMYLSAEKRLNDKVRELEKDILPTMDNMAEKTRDYQAKKRVQMEEVKEDVNTFRRELKRVVDESCDDLLEKLYYQNEIEFDDLIKRIDSQKRKICEMIKEINEMIQKGDLIMIKYSLCSPVTYIPECPTPEQTFPVFNPGKDIMTIIKEKTGTTEWTEKNNETRPVPCPIRIFDPSMINIDKIVSFDSKIRATSITTVGNNKAWFVSSDSDIMYLYDGSGDVVRCITMKGSNGINDMAIRQSGEMFVTCWDRKIRRVSVKEEVSSLIDTSPFRPYGVCLTDSEDVAVCMREQGKMNHVAVYSPDTGNKLRQISGTYSHGKKLITDPYRVVYNGKDLCVINWNPGNVVCVDEKGDVRWVFDGEMVKLTKSFDPRGMSVDRYNNLFVTDRNNACVHCIDRDGRLIQNILTVDQTWLSLPWGICVDDRTGHVWVGTYSKSVVICKYLS